MLSYLHTIPPIPVEIDSGILEELKTLCLSSMPSEAERSILAVKETTELYDLLLQQHSLKGVVPILNKIVPKVIHDLSPQVHSFVCPAQTTSQCHLVVIVNGIIGSLLPSLPASSLSICPIRLPVQHKFDKRGRAQLRNSAICMYVFVSFFML